MGFLFCHYRLQLRCCSSACPSTVRPTANKSLARILNKQRGVLSAEKSLRIPPPRSSFDHNRNLLSLVPDHQQRWNSSSSVKYKKETLLTSKPSASSCSSSPSSENGNEAAAKKEETKHNEKALLSQRDLDLIASSSVLYRSQPLYFPRGGRDPRDDNNKSTAENFAQRALGIGVGGYAMIKLGAKLKFAIPLLKLTKAGPLLSIALSSIAYSYIFGWPYALGMMSLIFIHESGHGLAMMARGIPVGRMTFIPFMGATIEMRGHGKSAYDKAYVAFGGPVLGSLSCLPLALYAISAESQLCLALARWGFLVNGINLLPFGGLDGGQIASCLSKHILLGGQLAFPVCALALQFHAPVFWLMWVLGWFPVYSRYFPSHDDPLGGVPPNYWDLSQNQQIAIIIAYVMTVGFCYNGYQLCDSLLKTPQQLKRENSRIMSAATNSSMPGESFFMTDPMEYFEEEQPMNVDTRYYYDDRDRFR